jgi:putative chitinase
MNLSKHFTLDEATFSATAVSRGLENMPDSVQLGRMKYTATKMEIVRTVLGNHPIKINSWFRGPEVNKAVGGVSTSQHSRGEAVDFTAPWTGLPLEVCKILMEHKGLIGYDQLIYEQTWIHISFVQGKKPRGNELTFLGKGNYKEGIA